MKKVTLTVVVEDTTDANILANEMCKSHIAQQGVYTLTCGYIEDLTDEEQELVDSELERY